MFRLKPDVFVLILCAHMGLDHCRRVPESMHADSKAVTSLLHTCRSGAPLQLESEMCAIPETRAYKRGENGGETVTRSSNSSSSEMIKWHQSSMELRLVQLCLLLSACCFSSGLSCRWIKHKFRHHHGVSLGLIRKMVSLTSCSFMRRFSFSLLFIERLGGIFVLKYYNLDF